MRVNTHTHMRRTRMVLWCTVSDIRDCGFTPPPRSPFPTSRQTLFLRPSTQPNAHRVDSNLLDHGGRLDGLFCNGALPETTLLHNIAAAGDGAGLH